MRFFVVVGLGFFWCVYVCVCIWEFLSFLGFLFGSVFVSVGAFCLVCCGVVWFFKLVFSSVLFVLVAVLVFVLLFVCFGGGFHLFLFIFRVCGWFFCLVGSFCWFVLPFLIFSCKSHSGCWDRTKIWVLPAEKAVLGVFATNAQSTTGAWHCPLCPCAGAQGHGPELGAEAVQAPRRQRALPETSHV